MLSTYALGQILNRAAAAAPSPGPSNTPTVHTPDPNIVNPGILGFLVVAAVGIATWMIIKAMNRSLARVPQDPDAEAKRWSVPLRKPGDPTIPVTTEPTSPAPTKPPARGE